MGVSLCYNSYKSSKIGIFCMCLVLGKSFFEVPPLSEQRPGLNPRPDRVGFVVDEVAFVLVRSVRLSSVTVIPLMFHSHASIYYRCSTTDSVVKQHTHPHTHTYIHHCFRTLTMLAFHVMKADQYKGQTKLTAFTFLVSTSHTTFH
jgi:hypothetical protein